MSGQATPLILLTRPAQASAGFADRLTASHPDAEVVISPLQQVRFLDWTAPPDRSEALILTSQNAVAAAARAGLTGLVFCVGDQTAQAAQRAGFDAVSAGGDAAHLVALIREKGPRSLWHLRGRTARGDVAGQLRQSGFVVQETVVYDTAPLPFSPQALAVLTGPRPVFLPLFSPKSAEIAARALIAATAPLTLLCLSAAVDQAAAAIPARQRLIARRPDADGMLEIVGMALNSGALS